jgi:cytoskeletal protein CcmA (bactofilin family)
MFKNSKEGPSFGGVNADVEERLSETKESQVRPVGGQGPSTEHPGSSSPTFIPFGTEFRGDLKSPGAVVLEGTIEGTVAASGNVQIGARSVCTGEIEGENVTVAGHVKGKVYAAVNVTLLTGSRIEGDVHAQALKIEDSVSFKGNCVMGQGARERHANERFTLPPSIKNAGVA